jgi:phytoene dehydrogenase-like protein
MASRYDVAILGGGHNGLVAACYLGMAGKKVLILESGPEEGGAAVSASPWYRWSPTASSKSWD